jgi:diguanylate cyclase (GGDEF)-like protein
MPMAPKSPDLQQQAMLDLADRARDGIMVHLPLWLAAGWFSGVARASAALYLGAAALFLVVLVLRRRFEHRLAPRSVHDRAAALGFNALILSNPLMWGALTSLTLLWPAIAPAREILSLITVGVVAAGSIVFAIDAWMRLFYGMTAMLPMAVIALLSRHELGTFYVVCTTLMLAYLMRASRVVHADYWAAARANAELQARSRQLEQMANTDALTQVANRQHFDRHIAQECKRAQRDGGLLSVLMIDVDHFKQVNDSHGHAAGDACLQAVARTLADNLRGGGDFVARYGGEEFAVVLPGADPAAAAATAERLRACVAMLEVRCSEPPITLTCSVGAHTAPPAHDLDPAQMVRAADRALYLAKANGRNCVMASDARIAGAATPTLH